jgi:anaerobic magnesium-protoporphyrin IX monomethyl ester cyclase
MTKNKLSKKVLLYFPSPLPYERNWHGVPLALLAISRILDKQKYKIHIYARHLQKKYLDELLADGNGAVCLGISAMTGFQIHDGLEVAKIFKKKYPHVPIIWGGWHPSILPGQTIANPYVDVVVRGPGDLTFPELVEALHQSKNLKNIKGITYKTKKRIVSTPDRGPVDLSLLPPLPYHLIDMEKCLQNTEYGSKTIPYISSYGCPHRCAFCVEEIVNKRQWRAVPSKIVLKEWQNLIKTYHADSIAVYDSNFFVDEKRVSEICQGMINKKMKLKWGNANGRAGQLSRYQEKTWKLMQKTGCAMILTGAESGSQNALDFISKDMNVDELVKFTQKCAQHKIKILYSFLVGLPWSKNPEENNKFVSEEYKATLGLIDKLLKICNRNRYTYYIFLPYPGASLFNRAVSLGLKYPKTLNGWSNYLMSPEDAFHETLKQKWISPHDAQLTAMLTQYIFGIMDRDTYDMLYPRIKSTIGKISFKIGYSFALILVTIRWQLKFFDLPLDYWFFSLIHRYGGIL